MNKKILLAILLLFSVSISFAQVAKDNLPAYMRLGKIPGFNMILAPDSTAYGSKNLSSKKTTILFVFSPDCDHCVHATEDLLVKYKTFKNTQIVMVTPLNMFWYLKKFQLQHELSKYPAIKVGWDKNNFFVPFYDMKTYPGVFVYDKNGKFKKAFGADVKFEEVAKYVN